MWEKEKKRFAGCVFLLLCTAVLLWACSGRQQAEQVQPPVMGIVFTASEDDWKDEQYRVLEEQAQAHGFDRMVMRTERTQQAQIDAIRALIVYRVDVIVFSPIVQSGWENVLREAQSAQIPVITVDKTLQQREGQAPVSSVSFPYRRAAQQAAAYVSGEGRGIAAELYGTLNASSAQEISRGLREGLEDSGTELKYSLCGDYLRSRGREIMETYMQAYPELAAVIAQNDAMALGAIDYLKQCGRQPGDDIALYVFGGGAEVLDCLKNGEITLVVQFDNLALAHETAHTALQLLEDPETLLQREARFSVLTEEAVG